MRVSNNSTILFGLVLVACLCSGLPAVAVDADLALRVHDAVGVPGGLVAVVIRTYASKPIGQGQVCLQSTPNAAGDPSQAVVSVEGAVVFSQAGDAVFEMGADLTGDPQMVVVSFESLSASINAADGPLAVIYLRLSDSVLPGQKFDVTVDIENSSLVDEFGQPVGILPRPGKLTIRAVGDPTLAAASAEDTFVGDVAYLSFQTFEPIPLGLGQVRFEYDPAIASGLPTVEIDPRYGQAIFSSYFPEPGVVLVQFKSPDASLNQVPGDIVAFRLPIAETVPPDTTSPVSVDPSATFLVDADGQFVPLTFEQDLLFIAGRVPGAVSGLVLDKPDGLELSLSWSPDCGTANTYAIYRGDLTLGYTSLEPEPGACEISGTSTSVPVGTRDAEFFLVVPHAGGLEGSYGSQGGDQPRPTPFTVCHPQGVVDDCAP